VNLTQWITFCLARPQLISCDLSLSLIQSKRFRQHGPERPAIPLAYYSSSGNHFLLPQLEPPYLLKGISMAVIFFPRFNH
jgi:hypothetical protein